MKHDAIFYGEIHRKIYGFGYKSYDDYIYYRRFYEPEFYDTTKRINKKEFLRLEIDNPPIEINERVYIEEIDKTVTIKDRIRNAKGGYIYFTDYIIEIVEDEETEKTKLGAENGQREYESVHQEKEKEEQNTDGEKIYTELPDIKLVPINNKKWYQFWK